MHRLLARSVAIGTEVSARTGEELIVWRTDKGQRFSTTYDNAAKYGTSA